MPHDGVTPGPARSRHWHGKGTYDRREPAATAAWAAGAWLCRSRTRVPRGPAPACVPTVAVPREGAGPALAASPRRSAGRPGLPGPARHPRQTRGRRGARPGTGRAARCSRRSVMAPARRLGSRRLVMAGRRPRTMGVRGRQGRRPAATTRRAHPGSRRLAGPAVQVRRRVGTGLPGAPGSGTRGHARPPLQAAPPVTPGPPRRARPSPVRGAEPVRATAGAVTRRPPRADPTISGRMWAGVTRVADTSRAPRAAGGPQHLVRSPAGRCRVVVRYRPAGRAWTAT